MDDEDEYDEYNEYEVEDNNTTYSIFGLIGIILIVCIIIIFFTNSSELEKTSAPIKDIDYPKKITKVNVSGSIQDIQVSKKNCTTDDCFSKNKIRGLL